MKTLLILLAVGILAACAGPAPTFRAQVYAGQLTAAAIADTCVDLSRRERISLERTIQCRNVVAQTSRGLDEALALGEAAGSDRLAGVTQMLLRLEQELLKESAK